MSFETYNTILEAIVSERFSDQADKAKKALTRWMLEVIYQESKGENIPQRGGGPGRGYFQYELSTGSGSGAGKTALNRYILFCSRHGVDDVEFAKDEVAGDSNLMALSADQQCAGFLADKNADPGAHFKALVDAYATSGWRSVSESNWRTGHYKGSPPHAWRGSGADELLHPPSIFASLLSILA